MNVALSTLSGVGYGGLTYFRNLLPALASVDTTNKYHIFVAKNSPMTALVSQKNFIFHECLGERNSCLLRFAWEQIVLPRILRKENIDVMFTAKNLNIFAATCKTVIAIRNVEPFYFTQHKNNWKLNVASWLKRALTRWSVKSSDWIIAVSHSTRRDLEKFSCAAEGKTDVIYNGNPVKKQPTLISVRKSSQEYLLTASKFVAYANQASLVEAYALLRRKKPDLPSLWIAGGVLDKDYFRHVNDRIQAHSLDDAVKVLGLVPHEKLIELYSQALAFIFPSTLEACPQTLIEAMACNVPIAASNIPPMPEICENAALYFEPFNQEDIADKIDQIVSNETLRNKLKQKSLIRAESFSWRRTAVEMVKVLEKVCQCDQ